MLRKLLLLTAGVLLGVLGLVGLVLPFLPGVLLLAAAALCLSMASRRLATGLESRLGRHPRYHQALCHWQRAHHLGAWQRLQLGFWLTLRCLVPRR